jgi:hypothetical protein
MPTLTSVTKDSEMNLITYYERHLKMRVAFRVDSEGNQIGNCGYGMTKQAAIDDIEYQNGAAK